MNIEDICFFDTETRALPETAGSTDANVNNAGTYRYAKKSFVIILTYAIGEAPVQCVANWNLNPDFFRSWTAMPADLTRHLDRAVAGKAWFAAWNAGFDRQAWNNSMPDDGYLRPENTIDAMAQAVASNLPAALGDASHAIGRDGKQADGRDLIRLFCSPNGGTPQSHPLEWERFKSYAIRDTEELREVWRHTRQLSMEEWREYWASERINDRGMMVDLDFCRKAAKVAELDRKRTNTLLHKYTDGYINSVFQHKLLAEWTWNNLVDTDARNMLVSKFDDDDEEGIKPDKLSLERSRVTRLIDRYIAIEKRDGGLSEIDQTILNVLQLREYGASNAPKKFSKIVQQHDDGALRGGYVWNGAPQTGRFSSKGVQVHNLTRAVLGRKGALEPEAIEMINDLEV